MVSLGLLALLYCRFTRKNDLAPPPQWWFRWPPVLLLGFVGLQLLPLPIWLLRVVSPARAALSQSLDPLLPGTAFATFSVFPSATLAHLLRVGAYTIVFVVTRELAWRTLEQRWLLMAPIVIIAGVEAVLGVLQYSPDSVAHGTYVNRNHFAGLLELSLPFAIVYPIATIARRGYQSFREAVLISVSLAFAAVMLLGIILSLSRMGFVAALCSLCIVGFLTPRTRASATRRFATAALVLTSFAAVSLYLAPDTLISRFGEVRETPAGIMPDTRTRVWKDTWTLVVDYPVVGCGFGAFEQAFPRYRTFVPQLAVDTVHNDYLQFLAELGVIGFWFCPLDLAHFDHLIWPTPVFC